MHLTLTNTALDKYIGFLSRFDNESKKKLIIRLTESIVTPAAASLDLASLFGAWEDTRTSDEIVNEIMGFRVNTRKIADL